MLDGAIEGADTDIPTGGDADAASVVSFNDEKRRELAQKGLGSLR